MTKLFAYFKQLILFLLRNSHTILLLIGISFIDYAAFKYHVLAGYVVTGISLIVISKMIDS